MVNRLFWNEADVLQKIAKVTHLTYNEINIIIYYLIIPFTWCIMIDIITKLPIFTIIWTLLWSVIIFTKRKNFSVWCDKVFKLSQQFICYFGEYIKYSVIICVVVPILIYIVLLYVIFAQ